MSLTIFEKNALFAVVCDHIQANYTSLDIKTAEAFFDKVSDTLSTSYGMERSGNAWRRKYDQLREEAYAFFIRPEDAWKADVRLCLRTVREAAPEDSAVVAENDAGGSSAPAAGPSQLPLFVPVVPPPARPAAPPAGPAGPSFVLPSQPLQQAQNSSAAAPGSAASAPTSGPSFDLPSRPLHPRQ